MVSYELALLCVLIAFSGGFVSGWFIGMKFKDEEKD